MRCSEPPRAIQAAISWVCFSLFRSRPRRSSLPPSPVPTFAKDVAPIFYRSCVNCHRPGQIAPMSLLTYEDARPWARSIKERVARREMPPWHIDKTVGIKEYKDDPSLSDGRSRRSSRWVDGGAPRGNPADMPKTPTFPSDDQWSIGTPDLIVSAPKYIVKANMADWFGSFYVDSGLTEDRWVKAIEVKPGDKRVVHHTIVYSHAERRGRSRRRSCRSARTTASTANAGTRLIEYAIGNLGDVYEDGTARLMKAGAKIHFSSHYHAIAEDVTEQTRVGIVFYPEGLQAEARPPEQAGRRQQSRHPAGRGRRAQRRLLHAEEAGEAACCSSRTCTTAARRWRSRPSIPIAASSSSATCRAST